MTPFGPTLKTWRTRRRMSQLDLGLQANVSARHISFLETGRSRPSRGMILRLCDRLEVPRDARNQLLAAAGLAPAYLARSRTASEMAPVEDAVRWMLDRHAPYPAFSIDRHWHLMAMNAPAQRLLGHVGIGPGDGLVDAVLENSVLQGALVNLDEVIRYGAARLRTESAHYGGDAVLETYVARLEAMIEGDPDDQVLPAIVPTIYDLGGVRLSLFSTIAQFGTAEDVALAELRVELMFPADAVSAQTLLHLAG